MAKLCVFQVLVIVTAVLAAVNAGNPSPTHTVAVEAMSLSETIRSAASRVWNALFGGVGPEEEWASSLRTVEPFAPVVRLSDWMGDLASVTGNLAFLDFAFPGSHDTMTFNLSYKTSEGDFENSTVVKVLRALPKWLVPKTFIKALGKAQAMGLKDQLENGIRVLDFRIMYTSGEWKGVHFAETHKKAVELATTVRSFMDAHPTELVTIYFSRHGDTCATGDNQYPDVSTTKKREFWKKMEETFGGLLVNHETSPLDTTTYNDLIARGQRVVVYLADYEEMTGGTPLAANACKHLTNSRPGNAYGLGKRDANLRAWFDGADEIQRKFKSERVFNIVPLSGAIRDSHTELLAWITYWPLTKDKNIKACAELFGDSVKGIDYCPEDLLRQGQMMNYYVQPALDYATDMGAVFPNALFVDSLDKDGTMRVDVTLAKDHSDARRYSFAPTVILSNIRKACRSEVQMNMEGGLDCKSALETVTAMRSKFPTKLWEDKKHGRLSHFFDSD